jgi:adenosine deaminase
MPSRIIPSSGISGHDQFFATFARFGGLNKDHVGEWLDEVAARAATQNEQYLEIMHTPSFSTAIKLGTEMGWPQASAAASEGMDVTGTTPAELSQLRERLLAAGLRDEVAADRAEFDDALASRRRIEHCGQPDAAAACSVKIRFLYQILRANAPQQVFAQTLLGFEVASVDPDVVGLNFVQPEDAYLAMSEYSRQMRMLDYLHSVYPSVHISLHAGELATGMVPPAGLRFHIRKAIDLGHAERIGHGVDVMDESDPQALLREMASRHVMVEINLTSNDVILGVTGNMHPLPSYLAAHIPVALSTDDEGVSRIDLTNEYTRAALEFNLSYAQLKDMARTGIEHSFLPGQNLWSRPDQHAAIIAACASDRIGAQDPKPACTAFLKANDKAAEEWELEHRFQVFESTLP